MGGIGIMSEKRRKQDDEMPFLLVLCLQKGEGEA